MLALQQCYALVAVLGTEALDHAAAVLLVSAASFCQSAEP
jgi:hypothetical protein